MTAAVIGAAPAPPAAPPAASRPSALLARLARHGDEPAAELLAMVWGPRFDREHALQLLRRMPAAPRGAARAIAVAAARFDALPPRGQQRVRSRIRRLVDNAACPASC